MPAPLRPRCVASVVALAVKPERVVARIQLAEAASQAIGPLVLRAIVPDELAHPILAAFDNLGRGNAGVQVAVRSSAVASCVASACSSPEASISASTMAVVCSASISSSV